MEHPSHPHIQGSETIVEEGAERLQETEIWEQWAKQCLLDMTGLLHSWIHCSCGSHTRSKQSTLQHRVGRGSQAPPLTEELWTSGGHWREGRSFPGKPTTLKWMVPWLRSTNWMDKLFFKRRGDKGRKSSQETLKKTVGQLTWAYIALRDCDSNKNVVGIHSANALGYKP